MQTNISYEWRLVGKIELCDKGKPFFPKVEAAPGLYRIALPDGRAYIGEASNLAHRMTEYRTPTGIEQERWICACLKEAKEAALFLIVGSEFSDTRNRIEREQIRKAVDSGAKLLNGNQDVTYEHIQHKIDYHEKQITRLRQMLTKIESEGKIT